MAIDLTPMLNQVLASDFVAVVVQVAATLAGIYCVIFGVMNALAMLRGQEAWSWGLASHLDWFEKHERDQEFRLRHKREVERAVKTREYRAWKKSKGL